MAISRKTFSNSVLPKYSDGTENTHSTGQISSITKSGSVSIKVTIFHQIYPTLDSKNPTLLLIVKYNVPPRQKVSSQINDTMMFFSHHIQNTSQFRNFNMKIFMSTWNMISRQELKVSMSKGDPRSKDVWVFSTWESALPPFNPSSNLV